MLLRGCCEGEKCREQQTKTYNNYVGIFGQDQILNVDLNVIMA